MLGLDRTDAHLRRVQTRSIRGQKLPQKYSSQAVAVPSWREFVRYLLLTDKLAYVSSTVTTSALFKSSHKSDNEASHYLMSADVRIPTGPW